MKYIQTFKTLEDAKEFKKSILEQKLTTPRKYILCIPSLKKILSFNSIDWKFSQKPIAFDYENESLSTKKFIDILIKNKMLGSQHDYDDKNIYVDEILNIKTLGKLFCGELNKETMSLSKPKNIINDLSCLEKLEYIEDISGIDSNGACMNLFAASGLKKVNLPKTLKIIGNSAFAFCTNLEDIKIGENVETIKSKAFFNCTKLEEIKIPKSVKKIESLVFANSGIKKIIMNCENVPIIAKTAFNKMPNDFEILVNENQYNDYVEQWSFIADHIFSR